MRINGQVTIRERLRPIAVRIRQAESRIMSPEHRESAERLGENFFPLEGDSREPWYGPTPMLALIEHLEKVKAELGLSSDLHFADLGSGLGNACIAAAEVFKRVTGFEVVPEVFNEAVSIRDEFGLTNIEYRNQDFFKTSWDPFQVIYFFKPFVQEDVFIQLMERLIVTKPGTVIISRRFMNSWLYQPGRFRYLEPLAGWTPPLENPYYPPAQFYTFIKTKDHIS